MSEFWISRPKWTCKYCNITINDDVPSKTQHLNGNRHKNAVERALKDVYKKSERERNDKERVAREMKKIEREAMKAHRGDLDRSAVAATAAAGTSTVAGPSTSGSAAPAPPPAWKPKDKYSAYSSAASLGFGLEMEEDQKAREQREERERERERREREGQPGEWEIVMPVARPRVVNEDGGQGWAARSNTLGTSNGIQPAASTSAIATSSEPGDPATQGTQRRGAFLSERVLDHSSDDEDDGLSRIRLKKKIKVDPSVAQANGGGVDRRALPHGQPVRLEIKPAAGVKAGVAAKQEESTHPAGKISPGAAEVKKEEPGSAADGVVAKAEPAGVEVKASPSEDTAAPSAKTPSPSNGGGGGGLFKKRRAGAGAGAKRIGQLR